MASLTLRGPVDTDAERSSAQLWNAADALRARLIPRVGQTRGVHHDNDSLPWVACWGRTVVRLAVTRLTIVALLLLAVPLPGGAQQSSSP